MILGTELICQPSTENRIFLEYKSSQIFPFREFLPDDKTRLAFKWETDLLLFGCYIMVFHTCTHTYCYTHARLGHPFYYAMVSQGCSIALLKRIMSSEATTYTNLFGCLLLEKNYNYSTIQQDDGNDNEAHFVFLMKDCNIVGHVLCSISRVL